MEPSMWMQYIPEIMIGIVLIFFAWAFKSLSKSLEDAPNKILEKLDGLTNEFHETRLQVEKRVTKVETEVQGIHKRLDRCEIIKKNNNSKV